MSNTDWHSEDEEETWRPKDSAIGGHKFKEEEFLKSAKKATPRPIGTEILWRCACGHSGNIYPQAIICGSCGTKRREKP